MKVHPFVGRFEAHVSDLLATVGGTTARPEAPWLIAVSGGLDSMVLLHLLGSIQPAAIHVGHVDHGMRGDSGSDAAWLHGVCTAWGLPITSTRLPEAPTSETEARAARYAALDRMRDAVHSPFVVTAHHADDVAETVLLRAARGTGPHGLAAILPHADGRLRPLLPFHREELETYARDVGLRWREDPTNRSTAIARNAVRREVLPLLESAVAPGARRALVRLAENAAEDRAAWDEVQPWIDERVEAEVRDASVSADFERVRTLGSALQGRVIRAWARQLRGHLDRAAVHRARSFLTTGTSGHEVDLGSGLRLRIDLDRVAVERTDGESDLREEHVVIESPVRGTGEAWLRGRVVRVAWAPHSHVLQRDFVPNGTEARFGLDSIRFPLTVRGRRPGDRIVTPVGRRKVKKVLLEARILSGDRDRLPLLVDDEDDVLWVPGVARRWPSESEGRMLTVRIET